MIGFVSVGQCIFGWKFFDIWNRFTGFFTGALILGGIAVEFEIGFTVFIILAILGGIIGSVLSTFFYKVSLFFNGFFNGFCSSYIICSWLVAVNKGLFGSSLLLMLIISICAAVICGVASLLWGKPVVVIQSSIGGGIITSCLLGLLFKTDIYVMVIIGAVLIAAGIIVQIKSTGGLRT